MAPPSLLWEAVATVLFNFALTGVTAAAALLQPLLPGADQVALVFALVMARTPGRGAWQSRQLTLSTSAGLPNAVCLSA